MKTNAPRTRSWLRGVHAPIALAALLVALAVELTFPPFDPREDPGFPFAFEVDIASADTGWAQVFVDTGHGFNVEQSSISPVTSNEPLRRHRFLLKRGLVRKLRLDPFNGPTSATTLRSARLVDAATGALVHEFPPASFAPNNQVAEFQIAGDLMRVVPADAANDPQLVVTFDPALQLGVGPRDAGWFRVMRALLVLVLCLGGAYAVRALGRTSPGARAVSVMRELGARHPRAVLALVAVAAAMVCCHPLIFDGRSLVSPGYGLPLVHPDHPGSPYVPESWRYVEDPRASDIGAMFWQHLPYSVIQHRALLIDGEPPLWNRYNSCGTELLGQGQSMLGDPFHVPVILAGGAAWAWDVKFVTARFLFALGCGFVAWAAVRHLGIASLLAFAAPFAGFFSYRLSHPAVFTFCYAPWILVAWLEVAAVRDARRLAGWMALVLVATWCVLTSGTAKEATMLALALNAVGFAAALPALRSGALRSRMVLLSALLGVAGVLILAPAWTGFVEALKVSWTSNTEAYALRLPAAQVVGAFDAMFLSEFLPDRTVGGPSTNFVVLAGVLAFAVTALRHRRDPAAWACGLGAVGAFSLALDVPWLPSRWILAAPGLANVGHVGYTFLCVAIPLLVPLAAQGFAALESATHKERRWALGIVGALMLALVAVHLSNVPGSWGQMRDVASLPSHEPAASHGFFLLCVAATLAGIAGLALATSWMRSSGDRRIAGVLLLAASLIPVLGRHGQLPEVGQSDYFVSPAPRADLAELSPVLRDLQQRTIQEPARVLGLNGHLFPGFTAVFGLEGPNGPDALVSRSYRELVETGGLARHDAWYFESGRADLEPRRRMLDLLNVRYFVSCPESPDVPSWLRPLGAEELTLFESPTAWPRAFFTDRIETGDGPEAVVDRLLQGDGRPFAMMAPADLARTEPAPGHVSEDRIVAGRDYTLGSNETAFTIDAPAAGVVVLMETWLPARFRAELDGQPTEVLRVNHAFKGVRVPGPGTHRVRFVFAPAPLRAATFAAGAGLLLAVASLGWAWRRPVRPPPAAGPTRPTS